MICYLDMDGVLVDFRRGICEAFGRDDPSNNWEFWEDWEGVWFSQINAACDSNFWSSLNWTSEGKQILDMVERKFENTYLLSTPMPNFESYEGKMRWIREHCSYYEKQSIITQAPKSLLAGPDRLLIDDKDENIAEFVAAGGQGILIPRPWNELHNWSDMVLEVLENSLDGFQLGL